jgi:hypothetical protein
MSPPRTEVARHGARRGATIGARRRPFGLAALALAAAFGCSGGTVYKKYEAGDEVRTWKLGGSTPRSRWPTT